MNHTLVTHYRTGQASPFVSGLEPPLLFWEAACVSREPRPTLRKSAEDMSVTCESIGSPIDCEYFKVAIQRWRGGTQMRCMFWWARCCLKGRATRSNGGESGRRGAIKRQRRAETKDGILMSGSDEVKEVIFAAIRSEDKYVADNEVGAAVGLG